MNRTTPINVAVVDDDESLCRSLSRLLRASDIRAVTYSSAEAFLADTKHPRFDCLVLDIQLGGMSGIDLAQQLADVADLTPIIFITAHDDEEAWEQAMAACCAAYFRKTDCGADVLDAIRRLAA
jgi:FixJ family two-component response regulator